MSDLLKEMRHASIARAQHALERRSLDVIRTSAIQSNPPPRLLLGKFDLIAECKLRAPSAGRLAADESATDLPDRGKRYTAGGAAAVSVLTEPLRFDGHLEHARAVARAIAPTPVMRKDFLVHPVQIWEAREIGCGGALLIARMLDDGELAAMLSAATQANLFILIEAFDVSDLQRSAAAARTWRGQQPVLVGVNSRDLRTLGVDGTRLERLGPHLPPGIPAVAESGMNTPQDIALSASWGYTAALVGSALMRSSDPTALVSDMLAAGRRACS